MEKFFRSFALSLMEDPEERDRKARARFTEAREVQKQRRAMWSEPVKEDAFWTNEKKLEYFKQVAATGGSDGKQSRYLATPTSRANSYDSVLEIYAKQRALANSS